MRKTEMTNRFGKQPRSWCYKLVYILHSQKTKGNPIFLFMEGNFFTDQWDPAPEILYLTSPPHPLRISPPYLVIINNPFCPDCFAYWIILFLPPKRKSLLYWVETQKLQIKQHMVYLQGRGVLGSFSGDHGAGVMKVKETAGGRAEQCCQDPGWRIQLRSC